MHASLCACAGFRGSESFAHMVTWHPPCKALGLGRGRFTLNIRQIIYIYISGPAQRPKKIDQLPLSDGIYIVSNGFLTYI